MNLNELARKIAKKEGKKKELTIAQVKEVIKLIGIELFIDSRPTVLGKNNPQQLYKKLVASGKRNFLKGIE